MTVNNAATVLRERALLTQEQLADRAGLITGTVQRTPAASTCCSAQALQRAVKPYL